VHDVFVLQVAGEKHWTIHAPVHADPLRTQPWQDRAAEVAAAAEREPVIDAVLRPGDALYLPRGYIHSAQALGAISAHLTVGVHSVTRWSAAEAALDLVRTLAADDPQLRTSLPLGVDLSDPDALSEDVAAVIAGLRDWLGRVDPAQVADRLRARTWAQVRPEPVAPLAQSTAAAALTDDVVLRLRRRLRCVLRDGADGQVTLLAGRRSHSFPGQVRDALSALLTVGELKIGDLPGLDGADRLALARRLVTESVATVPDADLADGAASGAGHDGPGGDGLWAEG
jgi:lysine-specific demethylase/histidyl-hydroxylase NO66